MLAKWPALGGGKRSAKIGRWVAFRPSRGNRIAKYLSAITMAPMRAVERATGFDAANGFEQLVSLDGNDRPAPQPGEEVVLHSQQHSGTVAFCPTQGELQKPLARNCLECISTG